MVFYGLVLKGKIRRDLQHYLAYRRAQWELEWENSPLYQRERERAVAEGRTVNIEPFGREQIVRSIPDELGGRRLRGTDNRHILVYISDVFVKETQRRVPSLKRDILEFDMEAWKK